MIFGREKELNTLSRNLLQGIHMVTYGIAGSGKTAVLREISSMLRIDHKQIIYIDNCRSRRDVLEGALSSLVQTRESNHRISIKDLRNELLTVCSKQAPCLVLDHVPVRLHHRMQRLFELLEEHCTLAFGATASHVALDLYYWKYDSLEVTNLARKAALEWIDVELRNLCYGNSPKRR
jgi:AAA+ ATPase superfamily predicted ATPase